jgi:hypothetical protein
MRMQDFDEMEMQRKDELPKKDSVVLHGIHHFLSTCTYKPTNLFWNFGRKNTLQYLSFFEMIPDPQIIANFDFPST